MAISVKITPGKSPGCRHVLCEFSDGKDTLKQSYHMDELEAVVKLVDKAEALKMAVARRLTIEMAKSGKLADACAAVTEVEV